MKKRFFIVMMSMLLCLCCFSACNGNNDPEVPTGPIASYTIKYYFEDLESGEYVIDNALTVSSSAEIGKTIIADAQNRAGYELDATLSVSSGVLQEGGLNLSLYYKIATYTIAFNTNGGSTVASQTIKYGEKLVKPEDPSKVDYVFDGWYTDDGVEFDFNTPVTEWIELTARWAKDNWGPTV